jgi:hypothetical protein
LSGRVSGPTSGATSGDLFDGTWNVTIATPIGKQVVVLEIATRDGAVRGTARQGAETVAFLDPVIDGNRMRWTQKVTRPLRLTLAFDVTVEGVSMTGTAKAGILPTSKLTGVRAW